jgi:uncharacterized protein YjbJ (UPF0337 family)
MTPSSIDERSGMSDAERMGDRLKHEAEELTGKVKEGIGHVTGDEELEAEGKGDQRSANVKQAGDDVRDVVDDVKDRLT